MSQLMYVDRYISQYGWAVASAAHTCTVYITVLVAVHRYVYVCCSHNAKRLSNLRRAKIHVAIVPVFAVCYSLPRVLEYKVHYPTSNSTSGTPDNLSTESNETSKDWSDVGQLQFTEIGSSFWFQIVYKNVCFYLVMYIVPLSVLVFVTVRLLATMRRRRRAAAAVDKRSMAVHGRQQARDDSVTVVLVIIIVVFIVCQTPTLFQRLMLALIGIKAMSCGQAYYYVEKLADYLAIFNSCVNFGIYVVFAPHFRRILLTNVLGLRRSSRSRRRREQVDGAAGRAKAPGKACATGRVMMGCAGKGAAATAAASSAATASCQGGGGCGGSSVWSDGGEYCSEIAECFRASSPTESSGKERQPRQHLSESDEIILNGVTGVSDLPLKPLLNRCN